MSKNDEIASQALFLLARHGPMDTRSLASKLGESTKDLSQVLKRNGKVFFRGKKWALRD